MHHRIHLLGSFYNCTTPVQTAHCKRHVVRRTRVELSGWPTAITAKYIETHRFCPRDAPHNWRLSGRPTARTARYVEMRRIVLERGLGAVPPPVRATHRTIGACPVGPPQMLRGVWSSRGAVLPAHHKKRSMAHRTIGACPVGPPKEPLNT